MDRDQDNASCPRTGSARDTERYLEGGREPMRCSSAATKYSRYPRATLIESNSILEVIEPDLLVFVEGEGEWKCSALHAAGKAQYVVKGHATRS